MSARAFGRSRYSGTPLPAFLSTDEVVKIERFGWAAIDAFLNGMTQGRDFGGVLLQKPQACANDLAGRTVPACCDLFLDEVLKMLPQGNAGVFAHASYHDP